MTKIGTTIIEDGLCEKQVQTIRKTARAIIMNEHKEVLMAYSNYYNDFMFPGGGIHHYENPLEALVREMKEELGAINPKVKEPFGYTEEIRYGYHGDHRVFQQISNYYICEIDGFGQQHLKGNETFYGIKPLWAKIDDVIQHNFQVLQDEKHQEKGLKTVLLRENQVLSKLKEIIDEKI
ncbi:MAG: NUDIX domain-containing protein [Acholeplasmataceae bacterium]|nr:NUDIX domain-containing protein [Acholeplasmataceae bacterium]